LWHLERWLLIPQLLGKENGEIDLWNSFWIFLWILPILTMFFGKISVVVPITNALIFFGRNNYYFRGVGKFFGFNCADFWKKLFYR